jgi:hypothetical protein
VVGSPRLHFPLSKGLRFLNFYFLERPGPMELAEPEVPEALEQKQLPKQEPQLRARRI